MKIRDTAVAHEGRVAAGSWLSKLRERRGLSQSELATSVGVPHYTFISQWETGRSSVPSYYILRLAEALGVSPSVFAAELLAFKDPFIHACIFGSAKEFEAALERALVPKPTGDLGLEEAIESQATQEAMGESPAALLLKVERRIGRKLHHQSLAQALRRLESRGVMRRIGRRWARTGAASGPSAH